MERNYYQKIKEEFINCEVYKKIKDYSKNRKELNTYYNVGKLLIEAQGGEDKAKYGNQLIKDYSIRLTHELGRGYSERSLQYMRKFYLFQKTQSLIAELTWTHFLELLKFDDINEINFYIIITKEQNLSVRDLKERIKSHEYQRLDENTKKKLIKKENTTITDFVKNPIIIKTNGKKVTSEKILQMIILEKIEGFLKELGPGFSFIGSEYKIKLEDTYNYIDLLLFNYQFNSFVVVELKTTELKKEHIGQIEIYMNYIDRNLKKVSQDKTIGIIICKKDNQFVIDYCSDKRIFATKYILS